MQGLSDHALAKDQVLAQELEHFAGTVVRVTVYQPYISVYVRFTPVELEFRTDYEGDVDERLDLEASDVLTALYMPGLLTDLTLQQCLYIEGRPDLTQFLVSLCEKWDLWNLLATICSEFMPFASQEASLGREEFQLFRHQLDDRLYVLSEQAQSTSNEQRRHGELLETIQSQLRVIRLLLVVLCGFVLLGAGLALWLVF